MLELLDGLITLAPTVAAFGDRTRAEALFREAEELVRRCADAGALPVRLRAARRAASLSPPSRIAPLSERELTVLRLLSGGMSEREIAAELVISFNTVHSHVKAIYRKLGASSRPEALDRARREALLP